MFGNRKRFLRLWNFIISIQRIDFIQYEPDKKTLHVHLINNSDLITDDVTPSEFEQIASALKHGRVKA
jgi:hypothetical protein